MSLKIGHVESKSMSLDQILEKPYVHIYSPIIMKPYQNVCLDKISDEFENRSCWVKNYVTKSNLRKTLCSRGHIFSPIIMKLGQNYFLD